MHKQVSVDNVLISINESGCSYDVCLCGRWQGRSTTPPPPSESESTSKKKKKFNKIVQIASGGACSG